MGIAYQTVQWNRQKRLYDFVLVGAVALYLLTFSGVTTVCYPYVTTEIMLMRALGTAAFLLMHFILCVGPLCRLTPRLLPLLYNRRHAGVVMFFLALIHGVLVITTYHAAGRINPFVSIFVSEHFAGTASTIPFQAFGFMALIILLLMAATSHDFWLVNLTALVWKRLHMLVYAAYLLLVLHVSFGVLQSEPSIIYSIAMGLGILIVGGLHFAAAAKEKPVDQEFKAAVKGDYVEVCPVDAIPENRARIFYVAGERVAVFKYDGKISAVSNICQHQNGPLGEGKIVDGCITCPWHGYQYLPVSGASPPPFTEKTPTFRVRVQNGYVLIHPHPNPPGVRCEPALIQT